MFTLTNWPILMGRVDESYQSPIYCAWISLTNSVFCNNEEFVFAYIESRKSEDYLRTEIELKLFE